MQNRKGDACLGIQQFIGNNLHSPLTWEETYLVNDDSDKSGKSQWSYWQFPVDSWDLSNLFTLIKPCFSNMYI